MKYERLTERDERGFPCIKGVSPENLYKGIDDMNEAVSVTWAVKRLAELEDKIESDELDYVADKDKQIASLTEENDNFTVELEVAQRDVENLTRTLEEANDEIKALEAENAVLSASLSKMKTVEKELRERLKNAVELPCKVGDTIYQTDTNGTRIFKSTVKNIIFETDGVAFDERAIGESIFLTEEAAKEKMKKLQENNNN